MSENPQSAPAQRYTAELAGQIETKWQDRWEELGTFYADNPTGDLAGPLASRNPFFILDMFPYPSGKGLHVGHPLGYIATDTLARYRRMKGDNVLYTMGYDAFGLPAEQFAVQTGQHPAITTNQNIANMRRQLRRMGLSHDSRRSFATTDIEYVHWTQWIFLQVFNSWFDPQATAPDGSQGAARPITALIALVWGVGLAMVTLVFVMMIVERRREFGTLVAVGAHKGLVSRIVLSEAVVVTVRSARSALT